MAKSAILYAEKENFMNWMIRNYQKMLFKEANKRKNDMKEYERLGKDEVVESLNKEIEILSISSSAINR